KQKTAYEIETLEFRRVLFRSGQLLDQFIEHQDEFAFAALVQRHSPMVWGVCRRIVAHHQDAEDAFQATFLVLARKATSIRPRARSEERRVGKEGRGRGRRAWR